LRTFPGIHEATTFLHQTWDSVSNIAAYCDGDAVEASGERGVPLGLIAVAPARSASVTGEQLTLALRLHPVRSEGPSQLLAKGGGQYGLSQPDGDTLAFEITTDRPWRLSVPVPANWYDTWHTVAAVYTGAALQLVVDGAMLGETEAAGFITYAPGGLVLGRHPLPGTPGSGIVSALRVYGVALPADMLDDESARPDGCLLDFRFDRLSAYTPISRNSPATTPPPPAEWQEALDAWRADNTMLASGTLYVPVPEAAFCAGLTADWEVGADGLRRAGGSTPLVWDEARNAACVAAGYALPDAEPGTAFWLTLYFHRDREGRRESVGWRQFRLPVHAPPLPGPNAGTLPPLEISEKDNTGYFKGDNFAVQIDLPTATITSWLVDGEELLELGPIHQLWRAPSWDEVAEGAEDSLALRWSRAGLAENMMGVTAMEALQSTPSRVALQFQGLVIRRNSDVLFEVSRGYALYGNGEIVLQQTLTQKMPLPPLGRVGLELRLPRDLNRFTWFGEGPAGLYADSRPGELTGRYTARADENFPAGGWPMERGHKAEVRWLALRNRAGRGIVLGSETPFTASLSPYSTFQLTEALHGDTLGPDSAFTLHVDHEFRPPGAPELGEPNAPGASWTTRIRMRALLPEDKDPWNFLKTAEPVEGDPTDQG